MSSDDLSKQRLTISVPTAHTRLVLGRVLDAPIAGQHSFVGLNGMTDHHLFLWSSQQTATLQAEKQLLLQSTTDTLSAIAKGETLLGSETRSTMLAAAQDVHIVAGYGPAVTKVQPTNDAGVVAADPPVPTTASLEAVTDTYDTAAILATASVSLLTGVMALAGTTAEKGSIPAYILLSTGVIMAVKSISEGASGRTLFSGYTESPSKGSVSIHGAKGVTTSAGLLSGITNLAPTGSFTAVGGITAGLIGGVASSIVGTLAASVTGIVTAGMSSLLSSTIASLGKAQLVARAGTAAVVGKTVEIGTVLFTWPQMLTRSITMKAMQKIEASITPAATTKLALAATKAEIQVGQFKIEVQPTGVAIKMGVSEKFLEITPTMSKLKQQLSNVEVKSNGVTIKAGPANNLKVDFTGATIKGQSIKIG